MAKTLQDYLGSNAYIAQDVLHIDLKQLFFKRFPDKSFPAGMHSKDDAVIAMLIGALDATTRPLFDENGLEVQNPEVAITSSKSFSPRTFEIRGGISQIKYEICFQRLLN